MLKRIISVILLASFVVGSKPVFPVYDFSVSTNQNGDILSITFEWYEYLKFSEEVSRLRTMETNTLRYFELDDEEKVSDIVIKKYEKKSSTKSNARNIIIITLISLATGFVAGVKARASI